MRAPKTVDPREGRKPGEPPWYLSGYKIAGLQKDVAGQLRDLDKLIKHAFWLSKITMKQAYSHYPNAEAWIRYRGEFFKRMREQFGVVERRLQEHRVKLAEALVRLDEMESALKRGQMMLSPEEDRKLRIHAAVLKGNLTRERKKVKPGEVTDAVPDPAFPAEDNAPAE